MKSRQKTIVIPALRSSRSDTASAVGRAPHLVRPVNTSSTGNRVHGIGCEIIPKEDRHWYAISRRAEQYRASDSVLDRRTHPKNNVKVSATFPYLGSQTLYQAIEQEARAAKTYSQWD